MSVFIDSGFFIALLNKRDENHSEAQEKLIQLKEKAYRLRMTSDYVLSEVITTLWGSTHRKDIVKKAYQFICDTPTFVTLNYFPREKLGLIWEKWNTLAEYPKRPLSFTDCSILVSMETMRIEYLLSFDSEFKGLIQYF